MKKVVPLIQLLDFTLKSTSLIQKLRVLGFQIFNLSSKINLQYICAIESFLLHRNMSVKVNITRLSNKRERMLTSIKLILSGTA